MKTLKSIMLGLVLLAACGVANATPNPVPASVAATATLSKSDALDIYTNAVIHGKLEGLEKALSNNVEFNMYRGEKVFKLNKQAVLDSFKASENVEQTCKYSTSTVEDSYTSMVVKLDMQYDTYVRTSIITIKLVGSDWKITKIDTHTA